MASACMNSVAMSPGSFLERAQAKFPSYEWLSAGISSSREFPEEDASETAVTKSSERTRSDASENAGAEKQGDSDPGNFGEDCVDFEFRLEDPVVMLPADELFCNGRLVPLQSCSVHRPVTSAPVSSEIRSLDAPKFHRINEISSTEPNLFSPKAPRCSSRWKEFIGLKKLYHNSKGKQEDRKTPSSMSSSNYGGRNSSRGLKNLMQRSTKSSLNASIDSSLDLPLLKDLDNESASISSRLSLSSSSSGHDNDDIPRLSLDSNKQRRNIPRNSHKTTRNTTRARVVKHRALSSDNPTAARVSRSSQRKASESNATASGGSEDSPRMNPSGKIVFHGLERSSSSPSTMNGSSRYKHRGIERSYSVNLRVTPVLNVPVCSLRGSSKSVVFGFPLFSAAQQKKEGGINGGGNRTQQNLCKNRTDRTRESS